MIFPAIHAIETELNTVVSAGLGNVGEILASGTNSTGRDVIISLINIQENRLSRDPQNFVRSGTGITMKNPAIHLNLTLLFTSVRLENGYQLALQDIQRVIEFFQRKYVFDQSNTPAMDNGIEKLALEMISLNLEQLQQLWSMLGGKYHPSVAYMMRMITIDSVTETNGPLITEIDASYSLKQ